MNKTKNVLSRPFERLVSASLSVDEESGLPENYGSFFAAYRPLMLSSAQRVNIPPQDREDAVQEVQIKFWQKNGLDMYDPDKGTKFATLLRNWAGLFMLQEMDKSNKNSKRYIPVEASDESYYFDRKLHDFSGNLVRERFVEQWLQRAQTALEAIDKHYLVAVLKLCVEAAETGKAPSRAEVAQVANVKIAKATPLLQELRKELTAAGLGIESLYDD